ncbi:alpha/beta hydrolase [Sphingobacteriales bacterium UPWRP_1]|nr:hypothetical protein BVG80_17030 [Sphingobacteriales bacterium TSM_CSM]PSJ74304.1 alpha/beta hydrolase [Sphingobacteriales bacterium UPWRP_1]
MTTLWFSHANGFPASCYRQFFNYFPQSEYRVLFIDKTAHGNYPPSHGWTALRNELIHGIETANAGKVVGVGHSMGGVITLLAALKRPDLFSRIILLDPPLFGRRKQWFMRTVRLLRLNRYIPPANKARKRRTHFNSKTEALEYFRHKPLFRNFTPDSLNNYVEYGLMPVPDSPGFELAFSAQTEYRLFCTTPVSYPKKRLTVPAHLIYANSYEVLWQNDLAWVKARFPEMELTCFSGGHLFPFEQPEAAANMVTQLAGSKLSAGV